MKKVVCLSGFIFLLLLSSVKAQKNEQKIRLAENSDSAIQKSAESFISRYTSDYALLNTASNEAQWKANTEIQPGDSTNNFASQKAQGAIAAFVGRKIIVDSITYFLKKKHELTELQVRQLNMILYIAGNSPEVAKDLVKQRIKKETEANSKLYGFTFTMNGKSISTNAIDEIMRTDTNLQRRLDAWVASKQVGKELKNDVVALRDLRNKTVQSIGYRDYFAYQVADYEMSTDEMMQLNEGFVRTIWPLYREMHTYIRYELAKRYNTTVPNYLPAHWLPNRWGQDWSDLVELKGADLDAALMNLPAREIISRGEKFYMSLGFNELPQTFWTKSNLYPYPTDSTLKKNTHASAWHIDLENDLRSLMSVEPTAYWWKTTHHELGHIFYYQAYSTAAVPKILRGGANRGYHEAMGDLVGLASTQLPYLQSQGLLPAFAKEDTMQKLFKEALDNIVFISWSAGVMTSFEKSLYADNLSSNQLNSRWWELVKKYQGIEPPIFRSEEYCDAATKTHIIDDAAQYYDYAISRCLVMQMHGYIANKILKQNPHATNYYGSKETGEFLRSIMKWGQARDWRRVLKESTGDELNANAMMDYFKPLLKWLKDQNTGKKHSLPEEVK